MESQELPANCAVAVDFPWVSPEIMHPIESLGLPPPPKSNIDTKNDGFLVFKMYLRLQIWRYFGYPC